MWCTLTFWKLLCQPFADLQCILKFLNLHKELRQEREVQLPLVALLGDSHNPLDGTAIEVINW